MSTHYGVHRSEFEMDLAHVCFGVLPKDIVEKTNREKFSFLECEPLEIMMAFLYEPSPCYDVISMLGAAINGLIGEGMSLSRGITNHEIDCKYNESLVKLPSARLVKNFTKTAPEPIRHQFSGPLRKHDHVEVSKAFEEAWAGLTLLALRWFQGHTNNIGLIMDTTDRAAFIQKHNRDPELLDENDSEHQSTENQGLSELAEHSYQQFKSSGHDGSGTSPVHDGTIYGTSEFVASIVIFDMNLKFPIFAREYRYTALHTRTQELVDWMMEIGIEPTVILGDRAFGQDGKIWNILLEFAQDKSTWVVLLRKSPGKGANGRLLRQQWRNLVNNVSQEPGSRRKYQAPRTRRARSPTRSGKTRWRNEKAPPSYWIHDVQPAWGQSRFPAHRICWFEDVKNPRKTKAGNWTAKRGTVVQPPLSNEGKRQTCYSGIVIITNREPTGFDKPGPTITLVLDWLAARWNIENLFKQISTHFGKSYSDSLYPRQYMYYQALTMVGAHAFWKGVNAIGDAKRTGRNPNPRGSQIGDSTLSS
jgi:hypothetical protein